MPALYVGKSLITVEQYRAFDPSHPGGGADEPATGVSFEQAGAYCAWYARMSKKAFRLPTAPEWEWACRSERLTRFPWGDDEAGGGAFAWTAESSAGRLHDVETKRANPFGLHDTIGLAWEWVVTPDGPALMGGSFRTPLAELWAWTRCEPTPGVVADAGFRILREL